MQFCQLFLQRLLTQFDLLSYIFWQLFQLFCIDQYLFIEFLLAFQSLLLGVFELLIMLFEGREHLVKFHTYLLELLFQIFSEKLRFTGQFGLIFSNFRRYLTRNSQRLVNFFPETLDVILQFFI